MWYGKLYVHLLNQSVRKLVPIYFITRKGVQQKAFDSIKYDVTNAPVLLMPNSTGHFVLVSDTSKTGCGAALYQKQKGKYHLIAYYWKKLPEAVERYSISELELTGVMANVAVFKHLLRKANFHVYCDHSALVYIPKAKREPPTLRLKKLIENSSEYKLTFISLKARRCIYQIFYQDIQMMKIHLMKLYLQLSC